MKVVFFGTSHFAARILFYLLERDVSIVAVVTRPDRPRGRSGHPSPPPVKEMLQKRPSPPLIYQPEKASSPEFIDALRPFAADLFVVVAYGEILKTDLLNLPKWGAINVHASLLPKYRGAAPIQRALMNGEAVTGVTIMEMVLQMDAGGIIEAIETPIPEEMTYGELEERLSQMASPALLKVIQAYSAGPVKKIPQNHALATFAPKILPEEGRILWEKPARVIHNLIRSLSPLPGAWCLLLTKEGEKRMKIKRSSVIEGVSGKPGATLQFDKEGWVVACGEGGLSLLEIQLEGKRVMGVEEFFRGSLQAPLLLSSTSNS